MKSAPKVNFFLIGTILVFLSIPTWSSQQNQLLRNNTVIKLFVISSALYNDFSKRLIANESGKTKLEMHLSDIKNYQILITDDESVYGIEFIPKALNGVTLRGGGGKYVVDAKTSSILEFIPFR